LETGTDRGTVPKDLRLGNGLWKSTGHVTQKGETRDPNTPVRLESNILKTAGDVI